MAGGGLVRRIPSVVGTDIKRPDPARGGTRAVLDRHPGDGRRRRRPCLLPGRSVRSVCARLPDDGARRLPVLPGIRPGHLAAALAGLAGLHRQPPAPGARRARLPCRATHPAPCLFWSPVASEIDAANIHLLIGAAAIYGLRRPGAWALVVLTKVTPGVGLLWFVVRRDWTALRTALLVTAAIVAVSAVLSPGAWVDWLGALAYNAQPAVRYTRPDANLDRAGRPGSPGGRGRDRGLARLGWTWLLPGAITLALPAVWFHALAILTAIPRRLMVDWSNRDASAGEGPTSASGVDGAIAGPSQPASPGLRS